jgi:hypothetical protein
MKILCVECDQAMQLVETKGPDRGSMTVVFSCPVCERQTAMLNNSMETQMVRTLGVKIGGRTVPAEPMEMVTQTLSDGVEPAFAETEEVEEVEAPAASKCPFTGMVTEAYARTSSGVVWNEAAEARISRIPSFAQAMVRKGIEQHAKERGYQVIDEQVMDEVKGIFGM